jgi:hypothetical protein
MTISGDDTHAGRAVAVCLFLIAAGGCASVPRLDNVSLVEVRLASPVDLERYANARERYSQDMFGGASLWDHQGNRVTFTHDEYDKYREYVNENHVPQIEELFRSHAPWPEVHLVLQSDHLLLNEDGLTFYLCDANSRGEKLVGLSGQLVWNGHILTPTPTRHVAELMKAAGQPQQYEIFFTYAYHDNWRLVEGKWVSTLLPLPEDLCVATRRFNIPFPTSVGRPMRISKDSINSALEPLPREVRQD